MTFKKLVLQNFGQFRGVHEIPLDISKEKSIVLIGGHNGGGKTTILDSMQLCLYGKRSNAYRRADQRWGEYLRAWISRDLEAKEETHIKLDFSHPFNGLESDFRVEFSWRSTGKNIQERKEVFINDILDQSITETWDKFVDSILPARLSTLFFFDGEQIENLVRPETAQQFLESAVTELLGIGIIEQLQSDLTTLNRNKLLKGRECKDVQELKDAEEEYSRTQKDIYHIEEHIAILRKQKRDEQKQLEILDSEYETKGGKLLDVQAANEKLKQELESQLKTLDKQIITEMSGVFPLHLVEKQLEEIKIQNMKEKTADGLSQQYQSLKHIHKKYTDVAKESGAADKVLEAIASLAENEFKQIEDKLESTSVYLNLSSDASQVIDTTLTELPRVKAHCGKLKKEKVQMEERLEKLNVQLEATPEKGSLKVLFDRRRDYSKSLTKVELELLSKKELLEQYRCKSNQQQERVLRLLGDSAQETAQHEDSQRIAQYSLKAQQYLKIFKDQLLSKHIGRLESYILESFQYLAKKQALIHSLKIEEKSFAIILTNRDGKNIPAEKLSAGERQLLAIAIFWGLQKASSRPIPVMIDTPMGRLDSIHREHLVRRYFPVAAHQVILLSTDEEIIDDYYSQISEHTCNEFIISYNEESRSTQIREGYFQ